MLPATAVPVKVGVVSLVLPLLATVPFSGAVLSLALVMTGLAGGGVPTVRLSGSLWPLSLPAASVRVKVRVYVPSGSGLMGVSVPVAES